MGTGILEHMTDGRVTNGGSATGHVLFDTAIGTCGIAWNDRGVVGLQLPERDVEDTATRSARAAGNSDHTPPQAPPPRIAKAIEAIIAHLDGSPDNLRWIELDTAGVPEFNRRVYETIRAIDSGSTLTYGEVAALAGAPGAAQAVGQALGRNPFPIIIPCHRVLAAGNKVGGFTAFGSTQTKRKLLAIEQAPGFDAPTLF